MNSIRKFAVGCEWQVTLPEWLTGSPAKYQDWYFERSGWSLTASVRIAQVTLFLL